MSRNIDWKQKNDFYRCLGITVITLVLSIISQQSRADELLGASTLVNMTVVGTLPPVDATDAQARISQLLDFVAQDVSKHIPNQILSQVRAHPITLILKEDIPMPEVFQASLADPSKLEIYLRPSVLMSDDAFQLLAHSYFHAIHYVIHPNEKTWIREGLAQVFEYMVLNRLNGSNVEASLQKPSTPLMGDYSLSENDPPQYGHDLLYFYYLYRDCGGETLFWKIATSKEGVFGADTLRLALENPNATSSVKDQCSSFETSVNDFEIAHALNHDSYSLKDQDRYKLISSTLPVGAPLTFLTASELKTLHEYQPIVLASDAVIPSLAAASSNGLREYWIEKAFPYSVQNTPPQALNSTWIQLLFRD